jgi:hypothetical protein
MKKYNEILKESADSLLESSYKEFFKTVLVKFGVKSPKELKGDKKKEFFDYIDKNWKSKNK